MFTPHSHTTIMTTGTEATTTLPNLPHYSTQKKNGKSRNYRRHFPKPLNKTTINLEKQNENLELPVPMLYQQKKKTMKKHKSKIAQRNYAPVPGPLLPTAPSRDNRIIFQLRPLCIKDRHSPKHIPIFHMHRFTNTTMKHHHNTAISKLWVDFIIKIPASNRAAVGPTNFYSALKNLLTLIPTNKPSQNPAKPFWDQEKSCWEGPV
jgi:hypothetical protein